MEAGTNPTNNQGNDVKPSGFVNRALNAIEMIGNKLPDPAALFLILLIVVWILSALLSTMTFAEIDPRSS